MPDFVRDILFILVLAGAWVAQQVLRRRTAARRDRRPPAPSKPVEETTARRPAADEVPPSDQAGSEAARTPEGKRDGTVAPEDQTARPETPPRRIAAIELSPRTMRQAIILSEVLGKPKSLR